MLVYGAQCVMMLGRVLMPMWYVDNLDTLARVSHLIKYFRFKIFLYMHALPVIQVPFLDLRLILVKEVVTYYWTMWAALV